MTQNDLDRRDFVKHTGVLLAAASSVGSLTACSEAPVVHVGSAGIGMCDWNLGPMCDPEQIPKAVEADLEGIQVSLGRSPEEIILRDPAVRQRYLELGRQHGVTFHSVALGLLNGNPLADQPRAALSCRIAIRSTAG